MDRAQFTEACGALASAWENISKSGEVFSIMSADDLTRSSVQMNWAPMRRIFPDTRIAFVQRNCKDYPWEAQINVAGVEVIALLTDAERYADLDEDTAKLRKEVAE